MLIRSLVPTGLLGPAFGRLTTPILGVAIAMLALFGQISATPLVAQQTESSASETTTQEETTNAEQSQETSASRPESEATGRRQRPGGGEPDADQDRAAEGQATAEGQPAPGRGGQGRGGSGRGGQGGPGQGGPGRGGQGRFQGQPGNNSATPSQAAALATTVMPQAWLDKFQWSPIGPANMSGRITSIAVYEKNPTTWWAASASGGLLKTENNGFTFEHQFDKQTVVSIGDVQVFQGDSNIVWVGTGEANPRNSSSWGNGVHKSIDGGKTWTHLGLDKTFQTGRLALHPTDANIAYFGALGRLWGENEERGIYKTADGGKTWEKVLFIDSKTGVVDLQMHPTNPDVLVAAAYERQRDGFDGNDPDKKFGPGAGIYKTSDAGKTWTKMSKGLPTCSMGRIGLNWSRSNPDHVFAIVESEKIGGGPEKIPYLGIRSQNAEIGVQVSSIVDNGPASKVLEVNDVVLQVEGELVLNSNEMNAAIGRQKVDDEIKLLVVRNGEKKEVTVKLGARPQPTPRPGREVTGPFSASLGGQQENVQDQQGENAAEFGGLYKSTDAGDTWERINSINPRPMYYSQVRIDPSDENNIYILGTSLYKSKDGGKTFSDDGHGNEVHVDHHSLWIDPRDSSHIILGNDGGLYVTYDRMKSWDHHNHIAIGQFYHVGLDATQDYKVYGGLQDNGSWGGPRRSRSGSVINSDWFRIGGGDGFVCLVDPQDADQLYSESQNGAMGSFNLRTGERGSIRPRGERGVRYRFNWKTPFILSPHNSQIHYSAGNYVFRSFSKGNNATSISPEITNTDEGAGSAISESAVEAGVLYVGTTDGAVWMTKDSGQNWEPIFSQPTAKQELKDAPPEPKKDDAAPAQKPDDAAADSVTAESENPAQTAPEEMKPDTQTQPEVAKEQADPISGTWDGTFAASDESAKGDFVMELTLGEDNVVVGSLTAEEETINLSQGKFDPETNTLQFAVETPFGALEPVMSVKYGKMTSEVPLGTGASLNIEATRRKPSSDRIFTKFSTQTATPTPEDVATQEPPAAAKQDDAQKADPKNKSAAVVGSWSGKMIREGQTFSEFTLNLKASPEGKISGTYANDRGDGEVIDGKYDATTQQLSVTIDTGRMEAAITAKVEGNKFNGEMDFGGGRFTLTVEAQRTTNAAATAKPAAANVVGSKPLGEWLPGPRWVSSLEASKHVRSRCYISLDGHRSNDDEVYLFASEDYGKTWRSMKSNLPTSAGSVRVLREDISNPEILYLGCEFSAWLSLDRGMSWTKFTGLPTVAVHEFAQHPTCGEVVAGTHGRSLWVLDVTPLRQLKADVVSKQASLLKPNKVIRWRSLPERGSNSTRTFEAATPATTANIHYTLTRAARSVVMTIRDVTGKEVYRTEGETAAGLQSLDWNLRQSAGSAGAGRRLSGASVGNGTYLVQLQVDNEMFSETLTIEGDPMYPEIGGNRQADLLDELEALGIED